MRIAAAADGIYLIEWIDGDLTLVDPEAKRPAVEAVLAKPVRVPRSIDVLDSKGVPVRIEDAMVPVDPGTPEHAYFAIRSLRGAIMLEGDDAIEGEPV